MPTRCLPMAVCPALRFFVGDMGRILWQGPSPSQAMRTALVSAFGPLAGLVRAGMPFFLRSFACVWPASLVAESFMYTGMSLAIKYMAELLYCAYQHVVTYSYTRTSHCSSMTDMWPAAGQC